jgi:adenosylcobinamide-GDP ribazoletransferase
MSHGPRWSRSVWLGFSSAVRFLSIIPIGRSDSFDARAAIPFFPTVGLMIGAILASIHTLAGFFWPGQVVAMLEVVALALLTGALHLDGLADAADGLYGARDPDRAMDIMKDSRIGSMGTVCVVLCLGFKWVGLVNISGPTTLWLLLVPAYARASILFAIKALPYGRPQGGTGQAFFQNPLKTKDFWSMGLLFAASFSIGWGAVGLNLGFVFFVLPILWWYRKKMQCVTGDMLGAMIEVIEAGLFVCAAARWGF